MSYLLRCRFGGGWGVQSGGCQIGGPELGVQFGVPNWGVHFGARIGGPEWGPELIVLGIWAVNTGSGGIWGPEWWNGGIYVSVGYPGECGEFGYFGVFGSVLRGEFWGIHRF